MALDRRNERQMIRRKARRRRFLHVRATDTAARMHPHAVEADHRRSRRECRQLASDVEVSTQPPRNRAEAAPFVEVAEQEMARGASRAAKLEHSLGLQR